MRCVRECCVHERGESSVNAGPTRCFRERCSRATKNNNISATAVCSKGTSRYIAKSKGYTQFDVGEVEASCGDDRTLWCYCYSKWAKCDKTAFAPSGSICKRSIPNVDNVGDLYNPHRRRRDEGLGAQVLALCAQAPSNSVGNKYVLDAGDNLGGALKDFC